MFVYNKYSNFSLEQIMDVGGYDKVCQKLLELATDEENKERIKNILYEGGFDDFTINTTMLKDNPYIEADKRAHFAYLLANHPDTFETMTKHNIILFHGTRIEALPSILKYGMNSVNASTREGIEITTGEKWSRIDGKRDFISFTNSIGTAISYALAGSDDEDNKSKEFGVVIGMSTESLEHLTTCTVYSDTPEVGIKDHIPTEHIKMLAVPPDKVEFVKKLVGNLPIEVMPMNIEAPCYGMDIFEMARTLEIDKEKRITETKSTPEYKQDDVKKMAKGRSLSRLLGWITKLTEKTVDGGKEDEAIDR